jgi:hypothetical protein
MAKLPILDRIRREDLPDSEDWVDNLIRPINRFMEAVYGALNLNLTLDENLAAQTKSIDFTTRSDYVSASAWDTIAFAPTTRNRPSVAWVGKISNLTTGAAIKAAVSISWKMNDSEQVQIDWVGGLAASTRYLLTVVVM